MMNEQLLKTSGADVLSSEEKLRKSLGGVTSTTAPPPPLYVRGLMWRNYYVVFLNLLAELILYQLSSNSSHKAAAAIEWKIVK